MGYKYWEIPKLTQAEFNNLIQAQNEKVNAQNQAAEKARRRSRRR